MSQTGPIAAIVVAGRLQATDDGPALMMPILVPERHGSNDALQIGRIHMPIGP